MLKSSSRQVIRLRGVRHNNLKNFDLDLPLNRLIVITGLSGSGKSSLAFDTLFAEGQRRYIETFSPYARQFFDRMDKPQVDSIEGIPPAIAIEQRNAVKTTRSTVGTMTEICDYMKVLWPHVSQLHCRQCGRPVRKETPKQIWETVSRECSGSGVAVADALITFEVPLSDKLSLDESMALIAKQGYQRILLDGKIVRLEDLHKSAQRRRFAAITIVQDRVRITGSARARFIEACEQAYHFGKGRLSVHMARAGQKVEKEPAAQRFDGAILKFSNHFHCAECDIEYREPSPALFSFNHPVGACPLCKGFGRVISIDYNLAIPDRSKTLAEGVVKPWQTGHGLESQQDLMKACRQLEIPTDVPFERLSRRWQEFVIEGEPDYGSDEEHEWPRAWYGVKGYFRWLESKAYKMHVRVLLSRYRAYTTCPECHGARFQPESLLYTLNFEDSKPRIGDGPASSTANPRSQMTLADFYALPVRDAVQLIEALRLQRGSAASDPIGIAFGEVRARLRYLNEVGLGYLTLDRATRSLSGGETERVNLTTCLGTRLVNTLFVLDEPSVGLHPRDTERLVRVLEQLRNAGNTVVVVEHEASVMRAADQIIDLGPGHGATGGNVVFQGTYPEIRSSAESLTGQYLSGRKAVEIPDRRPVTTAPAGRVPAPEAIAARGRNRAMVLRDAPGPMSNSGGSVPVLTLAHASRYNLKDVSVEIPLRRLVCVTGVSGSGKTTLIRELLMPALQARLNSRQAERTWNVKKASDRFGEETDNSNENDEGETGLESRSAAALVGWESLDRVVLVDQSILGKTPRSNPAVYIGAFDDIRELFAQSEVAKQRGFNASAFSFNSAQGQCERCRGAGFEKIEMQFLSDVFIRCPDCNGRRYRKHILGVRIQGTVGPKSEIRNPKSEGDGWSIADVLDATVDEVIAFLAGFPESRAAARAIASLKLLQEVGLGYLRLGQPINTLSGGESQRLKLVRHLAEATVETEVDGGGSKSEAMWQRSRSCAKPATCNLQPATPTLFLFDEPTTGLHFDDVRVLLKVFQRLVDSGHSVIVIEHNLDVIKSADWIIDLGPDAGDHGGEIVARGTPEDIAACELSFTGRSLRSIGLVDSGRRHG